MFRLKSKWSTKTSTGVVSKGIYLKDNREYLVKGNSESGTLEPFSEAIASSAAFILGFPTVEYYIAPAEDFKEIKVYGDCKYVSVCRRIDGNISQFARAVEFIIDKSLYTSSQFLSMYKNLGLSLEYLKDVFIIDSFVGNRDRHWNNIDMLEDGFNYKNAPILDYGASLLYHLKEHELVIYKDGQIGPDKCKPFKETHSKQMHYINRVIPTKPHIQIESKEIFFKSLYKRCESTFKCMSPKRVEAVKSYLWNRYDKYIAPHVYTTSINNNAIKALSKFDRNTQLSYLKNTLSYNDDQIKEILEQLERM